MIDIAFNTELKLEKWKKNRHDGSKEFYNNVESIPCYKEDKVTKIVRPTGEELDSRCNYFTLVEIGENDRIDGFDVLTTEVFSALGFKYYRSYV